MSVVGRKITLTFCEICKQEVKYFNRHLAKQHPEISQLDYFNKYIRTSESQGFCKTCGKPVTFIGPVVGFTTYCNSKCQMSDPDMQQKYKENYKAKTGYEHNFQNPECITKIRKTQIEKYGGIGWASKEIREKALNGIDNCMHIPAVVEKVKSTRLANNDKWCSDKQLAAIHDANMQPEKYEKAVATKYTKNNGKYESNETKLKRIISAKKHYEKFVKILDFNYQDECVCQCLKCNTIFKSLYSTIRTRILANINPCTNCVPFNYHNSQSKAEKELLSYIKSIYEDTIIENARNIISPKELDIYLPNRNLAFEFNGLYWHSELYKAADYHIAKTKACLQKGIQLIQIYEDDWLYKQDIVKSRIRGLLSLNDRIFARKCKIREVDLTEANIFLDNNHIQGSCNSKFRYGLYYNDELVSLMTFGKSRFTNDVELLRFCNKKYTNVIGGASKLLKHYLKMHNEVSKIISYADRNWSKGQLYEAIGFKLAGETAPSYYYIVDGIKQNRMNYQKHKLVDEGYNADKSEHEIMLARGIFRIYDSGNLKYIFTK